MAGIYKRGEIWWARVTHKGKERRQSLDTRSERVARERFVTFVADVKDGNKWGDGKRRTIDEAIRRFTQDHFPRIKPNSAKRYFVSIMNIANHMQGKYLDEIGSAVLSEFESARRREGVTNSTIRRDLVCLQVIYSCCEDWEWTDVNPARKYLKKAKRRGLVEANPRDRFLLVREEEALFETLRDMQATATGERDRHAYLMHEAAFAFAIDTGLRDEEMLSLLWRNVDLERKQVRVTADVAKSGKAREVPILPRSLKLLAALPRSKHSGYVFWHRDGKRYYELYKPLRKLCERAGVDPISFHDLRRTCGQRRMRVDGMSLEDVSKWLGHGDVKITQKVYAFLGVDELHAAVKRSHNTRHNLV
jgi:integrase